MMKYYIIGLKDGIPVYLAFIYNADNTTPVWRSKDALFPEIWSTKNQDVAIGLIAMTKIAFPEISNTLSIYAD